MSARSKNEFRFTGWHLAILMTAFFGVIIAVNVTMAVLANTSWTGLVVKNSYVESQKFNAYLAATRAQEKLGWQSEFSIDGGEVAWRLVDAQGRAVALRNVQAAFFRPVEEQHDFTLALTPQGDGRYATAASPKSGRWIVRLSADAGLEAPFTKVEHVVVGEEAAK